MDSYLAIWGCIMRYARNEGGNYIIPGGCN